MTLHSTGSEPPAGAAPSRITHIIIRELDAADGTPKRTIRIPVKVFTVASKLVPRVAREAMAKEGIDLDAIAQAAREIDSPVTLVEVEDHEKGRRIVVSLE